MKKKNAKEKEPKTRMSKYLIKLNYLIIILKTLKFTAASKLMSDYSQQSSIHGIQYLGKGRSHWTMKYG